MANLAIEMSVWAEQFKTLNLEQDTKVKSLTDSAKGIKREPRNWWIEDYEKLFYKTSNQEMALFNLKNGVLNTCRS